MYVMLVVGIQSCDERCSVYIHIYVFLCVLCTHPQDAIDEKQQQLHQVWACCISRWKRMMMGYGFATIPVFSMCKKKAMMSFSVAATDAEGWNSCFHPPFFSRFDMRYIIRMVPHLVVSLMVIASRVPTDGAI